MDKPVATDLSSSGRVEDMTQGSGRDRKARLALGGTGWIAVLGLLCAAAFDEGWFMALWIPVLLTAVKLWQRRKGGHQQPPSWRTDHRA